MQTLFFEIKELNSHRIWIEALSLRVPTRNMKTNKLEYLDFTEPLAAAKAHIDFWNLHVIEKQNKRVLQRIFFKNNVSEIDLWRGMYPEHLLHF